MKYDDASWHSEGDFPDDLPPEAGATHIGMFLAWAALSDLVSSSHERMFSAEVSKLRARRITPREYILLMDGKLSDEDLNEEGNGFARTYYDEHYLDDYVEVVGDDLPSLYHVEDGWKTYDRLASRLSQRLDDWRRSRRESAV